ncbi:phytase [Deinococcus radiophilus]|uniref:Phytase n=1 Tax=Deinococcus radiophilus TaxID=32062 RepID=A0A3S0L247_9DEIO|nr:phytase [Deinococcus radiophilus]RTR25205.1 phytase [Deinococcus radiophilus]UFA51831.1 phytase [Deinococcus radiophilus]
MLKYTALPALCLLLGACRPTQAQPEVPVIQAVSQTPSVAAPADSDDPAIWVDEMDPSRSFVIATRKEGGLTSFTLTGETLQDDNPGKVRYNNVDLVRGFNLGGQTVDLAVASERLSDRVAAFVIDPQIRQFREVTSPASSMLFTPIGEQSDGKRKAYGLAAYRTAAGQDRVLVTRNGYPTVGEFELFDDGQGVSLRPVAQYAFPAQSEGLEVEDPQFEGMVVDTTSGYAVLGQEQVGIWRLKLGTLQATLLDRVAPAGERLTADVEGLTIVRGKGTSGFLLVSSQGSNRYSVYDRLGERYYGSFQISLGDDLVTDSDGADVVTTNLGGRFAEGLLVVQDGDAGGQEDVTNFKLVSWGEVARALNLPPL